MLPGGQLQLKTQGLPRRTSGYALVTVRELGGDHFNPGQGQSTQTLPLPSLLAQPLSLIFRQVEAGFLISCQISEFFCSSEYFVQLSCHSLLFHSLSVCVPRAGVGARLSATHSDSSSYFTRSGGFLKITFPSRMKPGLED